ncbi:hypothetical protein M514_11216 [Trichuris suis]|uniref:Uncharacterized protein n=1 Tax=Trichuris suis TaxID=68888 RepID=A0A085NEV0_9BILA|nr:hypothetical protein M514_11216 [Trichuris suis]
MEADHDSESIFNAAGNELQTTGFNRTSNNKTRTTERPHHHLSYQQSTPLPVEKGDAEATNVVPSKADLVGVAAEEIAAFGTALKPPKNISPQSLLKRIQEKQEAAARRRE